MPATQEWAPLDLISRSEEFRFGWDMGAIYTNLLDMQPGTYSVCVCKDPSYETTLVGIARTLGYTLDLKDFEPLPDQVEPARYQRATFTKAHSITSGA